MKPEDYIEGITEMILRITNPDHLKRIYNFCQYLGKKEW